MWMIRIQQRNDHVIYCGMFKTRREARECKAVLEGKYTKMRIITVVEYTNETLDN